MKTKQKSPSYHNRWRVSTLNFEKSLVFSLLLFQFIFYLARYIDIGTPLYPDRIEKQLEILTLEKILPLQPPKPPPTRQVLVQPELMPEPKTVVDRLMPTIRPVMDRAKRAQGEENVQFDLAANTDLVIADRPNIGNLRNSDLINNRPFVGEDKPNLENTLAAKGPVDRHSVKLQVEVDTPSPIQKPPEENPALTMAEPRSEKPRATPRQEQAFSDILQADISLILTSSDLSMGVEEYQLWNRINAEFDRWEKGRYGELPANFHRKGRAIIATFAYPDGTGHHIIWLRGNTKIYVKGSSAGNRLTELKRALNALIQLNLKRNGY